MHHAINEYQLRLNVQWFLWPVYYIVIYLYYITRVLNINILFIYAGSLSCILECNQKTNQLPFLEKAWLHSYGRNASNVAK